MAMELPIKSVAIIGECIESRALAQVLKLEELKIAKEICTYSLYILEAKRSDSKFKSEIKEISLVILLSSINTPGVIQLIHILRSDIKWEGAFIAVVRNNKQKEELESSSLFFQREFRLYGDKNSFGHEVEFHPIKLCNLIETIKKSLPLGCSLWNDTWSSKSALIEILNYKPSSSMTINPLEKQTILEKINKIDTKLLPHEFKELESHVEFLKNLDNITDNSIDELKYQVSQLLTLNQDVQSDDK